MKPQAYTEFQPLEEVLIGRNFDSSLVDSFQQCSPNVKSLLKQLFDETEEDFQSLIKICKTYGAKVVRPDYNYRTMNLKEYPVGQYPYLNQPRDINIVIDNKIVFGNADTHHIIAVGKALAKYKDYFHIDRKNLHLLTCPSIVRLGEDIMIDVKPDAVTPEHYEYLKNLFPDYRFNFRRLTGDVKPMMGTTHSDSYFAILKPGLILTEKREHLYKDVYKGWDILEVERGWRQFNKKWIKPEKLRLHSRNGIYAFDHGRYDDDEFNKYVSDWLSEWVGYSQETVWDINCLVLDEENVVFSQENKELFKKLEKYKINPIVSPFRHRWFWDGGIHCISLDIRRKGNRERYLD